MSSNDKSLRIDVVDVGAIIAPQDKTLLHALEEADVHIHYHCREAVSYTHLTLPTILLV